jgi:hypothetical protein
LKNRAKAVDTVGISLIALVFRGKAAQSDPLGIEIGRRLGQALVAGALDDVLSKACGKFPIERRQGIYLARARICGSTIRVSPSARCADLYG